MRVFSVLVESERNEARRDSPLLCASETLQMTSHGFLAFVIREPARPEKARHLVHCPTIGSDLTQRIQRHMVFLTFRTKSSRAWMFCPLIVSLSDS